MNDIGESSEIRVSGAIEFIEIKKSWGKLRIDGHSRGFWVKESVIHLLPKDLKVGDYVSIVAKPAEAYDFVTSLVREREASEASASTPSPPSETKEVSLHAWSGGIQEVLIESTQPNLSNPNEMPPDVRDALREDMKANGPTAIDPILVRQLEMSKYEIVDGESRWNIARELGWKTIPARITRLNEDEARILCYRKNRERGTINPIKEALFFKEELSKGLSHEKIAVKYGVSKRQVGERLNLLQLPEPVQELVRARTCPSTHAEIIARVPDPQTQVKLATRVVREGLSSRELEELATRNTSKPKPPTELTQEEKPKRLGEPIDAGDFACNCCHGVYRILCHQNGRHSFEKIRSREIPIR